MVPDLDNNTVIPVPPDVTLHVVNTVNQSQLLSLFSSPEPASEQISSLQFFPTTGPDCVNKDLVFIIHHLLDDLEIILLQGNILPAHQLVRAGDDVGFLLIGVFHGMAPMARAIAEAVEKS